MSILSSLSASLPDSLPSTPFQIITTLILLWIGKEIATVLYNIFLHPLRKYPGPFWAGATGWWQFHLEMVKEESLAHLLQKLHEQHGPIIRIGPNKLDFSDPPAYHEIYDGSRRWDKEPVLYAAFGEDKSSFGLLRYKESKERKSVLQPLFSKRGILGLQHIIRGNAKTLIRVLGERGLAGQSSDMNYAFRSYAVDTITRFCFNTTLDTLHAPDFHAPIITAIEASLPTFHLFHHVPPIRKLIFGLPPKIAIAAAPETAGLTQFQLILKEQIEKISAQPEILEEGQHATIWHAILDKTKYKDGKVPDNDALFHEAQTVTLAGGVTVGDAMTAGFYCVLENPSLYRRLQEEVRSVWKDKDEMPSWEILEALPLLSATLKETLRISPGVTTPLPRIVPESGAVISGAHVPAGTIVGFSSWLLHMDPQLFPEPETFRPERWMSKDKEAANGLEKYLQPFSRGPRSCLGLNLAWCEMYIAMGSMLRLLECELDGVRKEDMQWRDCFTPYYAGRHLMVKCLPVED